MAEAAHVPERETPQRRRSLVLAGGGMRVAYQAGVIRALFESGLTFTHADGTSGGTINLAMLLSGLSPQAMCDRWRSLDVHDFVRLMEPRELARGSRPRGLGSARGLTERVFPHLGIDIGKINTSTGIAGTFNVCNFVSKTNEVIPHERLDTDMLVACVSLPIFNEPVAKNGTLYVDSVWIKDANCMQAVAQGADEIWVVWCIGNSSQYQAGAFNQYVHMIELSANSALFEEFERIAELNRRIARGERPDGRTKPIRVHLIKPEYPLPLDPELYLGRISTGALIDMGYRDASRYLERLPPDGIALSPEATRMRDPGLGVAFRELMSGPFALDATDPTAGARRGRDLRHRLTMEASIEVTDIDRFLNDPSHTGSITGRISFPPLGTHLPAKVGVFRLFSPGPNRDTKHMVYELGFEAGGEDYYLAGHKEVRNDRGLDMWRDVTTLFSKLHKGRDAKGRVIGAGVLTLSPLALARMLPTITARNAHSLAEYGQALAKFGAFFSERLYDSYVRPGGGAGRT